MKASFTSKDNNWQNGSTTYWFDVEFYAKGQDHNVSLGVVESGCDETKIVDDESCPIEGSWFECYVTDLTESVTDELRLD